MSETLFLKRLLAAAAGLFLTTLTSPPAGADLIPVRLWLGGGEAPTRIRPLHDGTRTFVPVEALRAAGVPHRLEPGDRGVTLFPGDDGARREVRLQQRGGHPMLPLEELARLLDAEVRGPAITGRDGRPRPAKPGDVVYLLARLREARVENGRLRVETSFEVPLRVGTADCDGSLEDYVECVGAVAAEGFAPAPLPPGEKRVRALEVEQAGPETVRIVMRLAEPEVEPPPTEGEAGGEPLLLDAFLRRVQANFPKLLAADAERRIARGKREEKAGAFDPVFVGGADYLRFPDSDRRGDLKSFRTSDAGIELLTPYGIKVFGGGRLYRGDVKSPLSPTGESGEYVLGVKVPLLQGRGINPKAAELRQARLGLPLADAEYDAVRLELLVKAAGAYWDWVAAGRRAWVARDLLKLAGVRAEAVRERAREGDLPLIDVVEADQEVRRREEGLTKAARDLQKETFKLSLFLWNDDETPAPLPAAAAIPAETAPSGEVPPSEVDEAKELALERRPELRALGASREILRVDLGLARNLRLPQVDVAVSPGVDTGFGGAGGTLKLGVSLGLPLRQRAADGQVDQARRKLEKLDYDLQLERQRILVEVDDAVSAVNLTYRRYQAAVQELELARRLEAGERERFDLGDSTLFLVNQRERATAEAANRVISILAEYEVALATFRAVSARL